ncbi:hypothetical protein ACFWNH_30870 [Rhodococcus qingshengii]|uniref:hypothetical protein n=1 Tax=Rhodococcus qingshengii TaxID=334542 RepID=UPI00237C931D|nr:hypothetical protein [Rhodococcus qingshengii]WCT06160.1 hypothetical protein PI247_31065 [Rhodococcus qingshengii]
MPSIIEGYDYYTESALTASATDAMNISPVSLSVAVSIAESSFACGAGVGTSIGITIGQGC